jgi:hypothetical protein
MKNLTIKAATFTLFSFLAASAYASIPYCPGTTVTGSKHQALQYVVNKFAETYGCEIGSNCLLNFDGFKYSIAWDNHCAASRSNDPRGATFACQNGTCTPYGYGNPSASY